MKPLDMLAKLFSGSSKCAALAFSKENKVLIARNDIFEKSEEKNGPIKHCGAIINLLHAFANDLDVDSYLLIAMEYLVLNYETQKHCNLDKALKKEIAHSAIIKSGILKNIKENEYLNKIRTLSQKTQTSSLSTAAEEFLKMIIRIRDLFQNDNQNPLKIAFRNKSNLEILKIDKEKVHAEMKILNKIINWELENTDLTYIGLSKSPCFHCSIIIKICNLLNHQIQTKNNNGSGKKFEWSLPLFFKKEFNAHLPGYIYNILAKKSQIEILQLKNLFDEVQSDYLFDMIKDYIISDLETLDCNLNINNRISKIKLVKIFRDMKKSLQKDQENLIKDLEKIIVSFENQEKNVEKEKENESEHQYQLSYSLLSDKEDIFPESYAKHLKWLVKWISDESDMNERKIIANVAINHPDYFKKDKFLELQMMDKTDKETALEKISNKELLEFSMKIEIEPETILKAMLNEKYQETIEITEIKWNKEEKTDKIEIGEIDLEMEVRDKAEFQVFSTEIDEKLPTKKKKIESYQESAKVLQETEEEK